MHRVSCGMLTRDGQVLLVHRAGSKTWYPNVWDFPGGHVEPGETGGQALVRELGEELGIDIDLPEDPPVLVLRAEDLVLELWRVDRWRGDVRNAAADEHDEIGWFTAAQAKSLDLADQEYAPLFDHLLG